ncbi:MAG: tyrosine-type recombinase/integrase, partial [Candidatus Aenigmarchaeota archaeon]|nr:tyrosine-type recombinase/integrase [Candidatus Aenigmarchaeota archaeon]
GYSIVATEKDLAGEVVDVIARHSQTQEVVVFKCGPSNVKKVIGYLERPNTSFWTLDSENRLFTFKRGPNWDSFMSYHKGQQTQPQAAQAETEVQQSTAPQMTEPEPEEPEIKPVESFETQTPAEVIAETEQAQKEPESEAPELSPEPEEEPKIEEPSPTPELEEKPKTEPEIRVEDTPEVPKESPEDDESCDESEDEEEKSQKGAVFTIGNRKLPRILMKEDVAQMIKISKPMPRDSILIQCMYFLGMTNSEVQNMVVKDIDFTSDRIKISEGKNRRDRILPLPAELSQDLKSYLGVRTDGYVIRGRDKKAKRISDRHIRRLVKAYAKEADVRNWEGIHPHTLRHSYATHLLDEGTPIETVQNILGHERLETTAIYSHARNTRELQDKINGAFEGN